MVAVKEEAWKVSASSKAKGFQIMLKVTNNVNRDWFSRSKGRLLNVSVRANLYGILLRVKVAAGKAVGKCEEQSLKWRHIKFSGRFGYHNIILSIKGLRKDSKEKPKIEICALSKSRISRVSLSVRHFLKNVRSMPKKLLARSSAKACGNSSFETDLAPVIGNLLVLLYLEIRKGKEANLIQNIGVSLTLVFLFQLFLAKSLRLPSFLAVSATCLLGFALNSFSHTNLLAYDVLRICTGLLGFSVLLQIIRLCFSPHLSRRKLHTIIATFLVLVTMISAKMEILSTVELKIREGFPHKTAIPRFISCPESQLLLKLKNLVDHAALSEMTNVLALVGNMMLILKTLLL